MSRIRQVIAATEFVGYHCSPHRILGPYQGVIEADYADPFFPDILDSIPYKLQDVYEKETGRHYSEIPKKYSQEFDNWADETAEFFERHNIEWIFVSIDDPLGEFGDYCYNVYLDPNKSIGVPDYHVRSGAMFYLYDSTKVTPRLELLEDE